MRLVALTANRPEFHGVRFREGLNVILAARTEHAGDQDSRNGVGKSSLLQLIDYCLGSSNLPANLAKGLKGTGWVFTLDMKFGQELVSVSRDVDTGQIAVAKGPESLHELANKDGYIAATKWRRWLGQQWYGLTGSIAAYPSFRQCILFNLRTAGAAYVSPFVLRTSERAFQTQQTNSFLVGLSMDLVARWDILRRRGQLLDAMTESTKEDATTQQSMLLGDRGRLEAQRNALREQLDQFEVFPEYREVEAQTNKLTREAQALVNQMTTNGRLLDLYQEQQQESKEPQPEDLWTVFADAGAAIGEGFKRSVDEVVAFHHAVAANREEYLRSEISTLQTEQQQLSARLALVDQERGTLLDLLKSRGALDEFVELEQRYARLSGEIESLSARLAVLESVTKDKGALKVDLAQTARDAEVDYFERANQLAVLLGAFSGIVEQLYGKQGHLRITVGESGYKFGTDMPRDGSHGVGKMAIFAYDLAVNTRLAGLPRSPGFLAHDSVLFDGVDERQRAIAIRLAKEFAAANNYQYIMTINSDMLPENDLDAAGVSRKELMESVVLELGDKAPADALFGFRWED